MGPQSLDSDRVDLIDSSGPNGLLGYETCMLEDPQMLRDCRAADGKAAGKLNDRQGLLSQALKNGQPRRIADRLQTGL